jgi:glycosyltransferase involved in cell wall biosynthesis
MKPLAIVIPWFGRDLKGGAETQTWQIATRLAARGHAVEVLTTCCHSHHDNWAVNHLPAGLAKEPEGFSIRRFPVARRNKRAFERVMGRLHGLHKSALKPGVSPLNETETAVFSHELIKSPSLLAHLTRHAKDYHAFVFIPYLYGPILNGLPLVSGKAWLQPCLHDESYAYLPPVARIFHQARGVLFNSEGEMELALRLYGPAIQPKSIVVGEGVEVPEIAAPEHRRARPAVLGDTPYVLCLGRKERGKNSHLLLDAFRRFKAAHPASRLKLVYAGVGRIHVDDLPGQAYDLGVVSEADKLALLDGCRALFQPSENESFSRVMMEAWLRARPVAAHRDCLATATAVRHCDGGWLAADEAEWSALFAELERLPQETLAAKAAAGQRYARDIADWDRVMDRYEAVLFAERAHEPRLPRATRQAVHQVLPNMSYGDAISNHARWIRGQLRQMGFDSEIFVRYVDPRVAAECRVFSPGCIKPADAVLYHHSIGSELTPHVVAHTGPKCLIYHNVTPPEFYELFRPEFAELLRQGRESLKRLAREFPISAGVSGYNANELSEAGFNSPGVMPLCIDPTQWNLLPDARLMRELQRGHNNLLFVGRLSPSKKQDDLLRAFKAYLEFDPAAALHIVGDGEPDDPYVAYLRHTAKVLGLAGRVNFAGMVNDAQLAAYYRTARIFWSMSEHEGFCVPLVEAMWHDVPVLAYKSSAVAETLGAGGVLFTRKANLSEAAAAAWFLVQDAALRAKVIAAQRQRRLFCSPAVVAAELRKLIERVLSANPQGDACHG